MLPFLASYDVSQAGGVLALMLAIGAVAVCIHLAARWLIKKDDVLRAFVASTFGILMALLALALVKDYWIVGVLLGIAGFMLAIGVVYRAKAQAAVSVGAVTFVLWIVASLGLRYVQDHWHS